MSKKFLALLFSLLLFNSCAYSNKTFDSVVLFGDSLSDNGNLWWYMLGFLPLSPPYYEGHFSNGQNWAEYLYESLYHGENLQGFRDYAVGGAGAVLSYKENLPYTLSFEVSNYIYWHTYENPERSLFTIWIGANNYLNGPTNIDEITRKVVDAISSGVERLVQVGGVKFIIANLPDLGYTPQARELGKEALLTSLTNAHNEKLARKVSELQARYPDVEILMFDAYKLFQEVTDNPSAFGFSNTEHACYLGSYTGWLQAMQINSNVVYSGVKARVTGLGSLTWEDLRHNPQLMTAVKLGEVYQHLPSWMKNEPPDCKGYVFWDHVHPTTDVHRIIAKKVEALIRSANFQAVPLPSGLKEMVP